MAINCPDFSLNLDNLIGQYASCLLSNLTVRALTRALKWLFFFNTSKKNWNFFCFDFKKGPYISQILLKLWLIGNRTSCRPIQSVIILVIKQIGLPLLEWLQIELDSTQSCYHYLSLLLLLNTLLQIYTQWQKGKKAITKATKEIVKKKYKNDKIIITK